MSAAGCITYILAGNAELIIAPKRIKSFQSVKINTPPMEFDQAKPYEVASQP
jgi:hypothetical protein